MREIEEAAKAACCPTWCICGSYDDPRCAWRDSIINARACIAAYLRASMEPSEAMVDRIAKALAETEDAPWDELDEEGGATAVNPFGLPRSHYREQARKAIKAMTAEVAEVEK